MFPLCEPCCAASDIHPMYNTVFHDVVVHIIACPLLDSRWRRRQPINIVPQIRIQKHSETRGYRCG